MYDYDKAKEIGERACSASSNPTHITRCCSTVAAGPALDAVGFKQLQWPGHGVRDDQPYQYLDREYMKADEYDDFLFDPTGFYLQQISAAGRRRVRGPRGIARSPRPALFPPGRRDTRPFAKPKVRAAFEQAVEGRRGGGPLRPSTMSTSPNAWRRSASRLSHISTSVAPYDLIADYFRGATGMMKDLYRKKDKLLQLLDKACDLPDAADDRTGRRPPGTRSCSSRSTGRRTPSCRRSSSRPSGGRRSAS